MAYGTEHVTHYLGYIDEKNIWPRYGGLHWWFLNNYSCSNITLTISVSTLTEIFNHIIQHQVTSWGTRHTQHTHIFCSHLETYAMKWNTQHPIPCSEHGIGCTSLKWPKATQAMHAPQKTCEKITHFKRKRKHHFFQILFFRELIEGLFT